MSNQHCTATGYPAPPPSTHAAGGYPYAAPPPNYSTNANPNPNSYYYNAPYVNADRVSNYRRYFMLFVASTLALMAIALLVIYLVLRPTVPRFRINSLSLTGFKDSAASVSGNWTASFTVANPNKKMRVFYNDLDGTVYYRSEIFATNRLAPFGQETESERNMSATFIATSAYVGGRVVNGINDDRSRGSVKFNLKIVAIAHFKARGWWSRRRILRVFCDDLPVGMSSNSTDGALTGGPQDCGVVV